MFLFLRLATWVAKIFTPRRRPTPRHAPAVEGLESRIVPDAAPAFVPAAAGIARAADETDNVAYIRDAAFQVFCVPPLAPLNISKLSGGSGGERAGVPAEFAVSGLSFTPAEPFEGFEFPDMEQRERDFDFFDEEEGPCRPPVSLVDQLFASADDGGYDPFVAADVAAPADAVCVAVAI